MTNERKIFITGFTVLLVLIFYMFTRIERLEEEVAGQSTQASDLQHAIETESNNRYRENQQAKAEATSQAMFKHLLD
jgi:hypothetical protein